MEKPISFKLAKLNTEQFATIDSAYPAEGENVEIFYNFSFNVSPANRFIKCGINFSFENGKIVFLVLSTNCEFLIDDEGWESLQRENGKIEIEKGFAQHLAVLTTGTARGILHAKTENTKFNKYILPTLNLTEIFTENIVIKVDD